MAHFDTAGDPYHPSDDHLVSVLTPLYGKGVEYLSQAWDSLSDQQLPDGYRLEWVVQDDAEGEAHRELVETITAGDRRVRYAANGRQCGQAVARTMALRRSRGGQVYALDQDDLLEPGALSGLLEVLCEHPEVMWVTGKVQRLYEDGRIEERIDPLGFGPVGAGVLVEMFEAGVTTAFYPTATMYRRRALELVGGWPAVVAAEDAELQLVMGAAFDGWRVEQTLLTRRKWSGQAVAAAWYESPDQHAITERYARAKSVDDARRSGATYLPVRQLGEADGA